MPKYIDISKIQYEEKENIDGYVYSEVVRRSKIESMPAEDVKPVIHAKWIYDEDCVICSHCGKAFSLSSNYCPNCGAEMEISNSDDDCYTDEVGGHHDCGIGWNPNGYWCGECPKLSCEGCVNIDKN